MNIKIKAGERLADLAEVLDHDAMVSDVWVASIVRVVVHHCKIVAEADKVGRILAAVEMNKRLDHQVINSENVVRIKWEVTENSKCGDKTYVLTFSSGNKIVPS